MRGTALLTALVVVVMVAGMTTAMLSLTGMRVQQTAATVAGRKAEAISESGAVAYIDALNAGRLRPPAGLTGAYAGGSYRVTAAAHGARWLVRSTGEFRGIVKVVTMEVAYEAPPPLPGGRVGALNLFGFGDLKLKLQENRNLIRIRGGRSAGIVIQNTDAFTGPSVLGVVNDMYDRRLSRDAITGALKTPFQVGPRRRRTRFEVSIVNEPRLRYDAEMWEAFAERMESHALRPADLRVVGRDLSGVSVWGTLGRPQTVVIDGRVNLHRGSIIKGYGTLIVTGDFHMHQDAQIDWAGNVIVVGNANRRAGAADLHLHQASMVVRGGLYVVGRTQNARVHMHDGSARIEGMVAVLASEEDKADVHLHKGTWQVDGAFVMMGREKAKLHTHEPNGRDDVANGFKVAGAAFVGISHPSRRGRIDVHIHGGAEIVYDPVKAALAVGELDRMMAAVGTPAGRRVYVVRGWSQNFAP